jgi:hypothetical protein
LQTLVGNFDGNTKGKEQIIMLHYNKWYDSDYVYVTWCGMDSSGDISANLREIWNKGNDYCYPAICATDIYNQGITLEFEPSKSKFMYSNPTVISVLGASPFYKELEDKQANLSNVGTTYGSETENSNSVSNGLTAEVGVSFGFSQSIGVFGIEFGSMGFETQITNSFSASWTKAKSISKGISFTNLYMEDAVVLMVIPSDVYYYKVYANNNGTIVESEMVMNVPYSPVTTIMPLEDYNQVAATIENAPVIGPEVLKHTVGNPRSYPQRSQGLSNIEGNDVLLAGNDENESFIGSGTGNSVVQQSITTSSTSEKSFDYALSIDVSYNVSIFGVSSGISAGAGYTRNVTISSSESTIRAGSVASVPVENSGYSFMWALAAYNYDLSAGDSTQECTVISYLVKPIGSFPPLVPSNLRVDSRTLLATTLKWDPAEGAAGYRIFRAPSLSDSFIEITDPLTGKDSTSYTDEDLTPNQNYSYIILAYSGRESIKTEPLKVKSLSIKDIRIKTQPKLTYDEEEPLDLSALIVRLKINDDSTQDISFADFSKYSITTNFGHGVAIKVTDSGIPITVKYKPVNMMVNTNVLTVNAKSPYDLTLSVTFEVGSTNNATELKPNKTLKARIELTNKQSSDHRVLLVLALFSDKGNMVQYTSFSRTIHAGITRELAPLTLELPNNVNGYTAKVFVWDGENFTTTTLTPKSESAQIPTR